MTRIVLLTSSALLALAVSNGADAQASDASAQPPASQSSDQTTAPTAPSDAVSAICTDRPTKASAPCTVDVGHLQLETDLFNGSFLRVNGVTTDTYYTTNPTLKYGLSKTIDVEVNIAPYEVVRTNGPSGESSVGGVGDLYFRLKWNVFNSADGRFSVSVLPYVKAPTARSGIGDRAVEGGTVFPISYKLTDKLTATTAPEFDAYKDALGDGRHLNTAQMINLGYSLPHSITVYGELWGDWNFDPAGEVRQYSADVAAAWGLTSTLQLDGGLNFGLNRQTPGVQAYVGISQKF